jgi:hypothetical protein
MWGTEGLGAMNPCDTLYVHCLSWLIANVSTVAINMWPASNGLIGPSRLRTVVNNTVSFSLTEYGILHD